MEKTIELKIPTAQYRVTGNQLLTNKKTNSSCRVGIAEKFFVQLRIKIKLIYFAFRIFKTPVKVYRAFQSMIELRNKINGGSLKKLYKVNGKYYAAPYRPGYPSKIFDHFLKNELLRLANPTTVTEKLSFVFFAITGKCPMRCEHCFEWDHLNKKEQFTKAELFQVIDLYQQEGVVQFHFSGGEPMTRIKDLLPLIQHASKKSECWVLTAGFNFTNENALLLKQAGCSAVVISIDHYEPVLHNRFRGYGNAFELAVQAVAEAKQAGLVTAVSICTTKEFIDNGHLMPYLQFAKELGVQFVQVLEPRAVGHYENKNVLLEEKHIAVLESIFKKMNHEPEYLGFPTLVYHGFHQRRLGCFSGNRSLYIDAAGDVHACPFCHTKSYNVIDLIRAKAKKLPQKEIKCQLFEPV